MSLDFNSTFLRLPNPVIAVDDALRVIFVNQKALSTFHFDKYPADDVTCYQAVHDMPSRPKSCHCGVGASQTQTCRIFEASLGTVFDIIYIPLPNEGNAFGGILIYEQIVDRIEKCAEVPEPDEPMKLLYDNRESLTAKEKEVLNLIMEGRSNEDICSILKVSQNTITFHLKNLYQKLGATNRTQAAAYAFNRAMQIKEIQYRELTHRVKNDFAVLYSLVSAKAESSEGKTREALRWISGMIKCHAALHQTLNRQPGIGSISLRGFLTEALSHMDIIIKADRRSLDLRSSMEDVHVSHKVAVPCAEIVIELVHNAMKHAFQGMDAGVIEVELKQAPQPGAIMLKVRDNGVGLPEQALKKNTLGIKIIEALLRQVGGSMEIKRSGGTEVAITFGDGLS